MIIPIALGALGVLILLGSIKIVRPTQNGLVETLGRYTKTAKEGLHIVIPIIQTIRLVNITERRVDVDPQFIITDDDLNVQVDGIVYYRVKNPKLAVYEVNDFATSVPSLAKTTLRAVVGKMSLSKMNKSRDEINQELAKELDRQTDAWGIDVIRVELQSIVPPEDIQRAMNDVVRAKQERVSATDFANAVEIKAKGEKRARIAEAEGERESAVLKAKGYAEAIVLEAESKAKAFNLVEASFKGNAVKLKELEVTENSLKNNSKIILTEKGITPQLLIGNLPLGK